MQEVEKSNVVQIRDYARRRAKSTRADIATAGLAASAQGELCLWPRVPAPYPGGIDDLPV
jgi:hypothetical protein